MIKWFGIMTDTHAIDDVTFDFIGTQIQIQYSLRITICNQHEVHNLTRLFCYNSTKWLIDLGREKVSFKNIEFSSILGRTFFH